MTEPAAPEAGGPQRPGSQARRWDISHAILALLKSGPKTLSMLYRRLNPGLPKGVLRWAGSRGPRSARPRVDKRTIRRHLGYLRRDGLVASELWLKVLRRDRDIYTWRVTYYHRADLQDPAPPGGASPGPAGRVSEIHNPLPGEEGALRFIRWLRDPR